MLKIAMALYPDWHPVRVNCKLFCIETVAHRLLKWGWEEHVNDYDSRELVLLAYYLPRSSQPALLREAMRKAIAEGRTQILERAGVERVAA